MKQGLHNLEEMASRKHYTCPDQVAFSIMQGKNILYYWWMLGSRQI
jgi:hypothetical protein